MQNSCEVLMNIAYNVQRCYSNEMNIKMFMNNPTMYSIRNTLQKKKKKERNTLQIQCHGQFESKKVDEDIPHQYSFIKKEWFYSDLIKYISEQ